MLSSSLPPNQRLDRSLRWLAFIIGLVLFMAALDRALWLRATDLADKRDNLNLALACMIASVMVGLFLYFVLAPTLAARIYWVNPFAVGFWERTRTGVQRAPAGLYFGSRLRRLFYADQQMRFALEVSAEYGPKQIIRYGIEFKGEVSAGAARAFHDWLQPLDEMLGDKSALHQDIAVHKILRQGRRNLALPFRVMFPLSLDGEQQCSHPQRNRAWLHFNERSRADLRSVK